MWKRIGTFRRHHFGVRNRAPWLSIFNHALHQFHENDLFTPAAAMSYFGLLTLFPLLLVLLSLSNHFDIGNEMLRRAVEVYPGSREFLRSTVRSLENVSTGVIVTCIVVTLWAGSWVFNVVERAINRLWGTRPRAMLRGRGLTLLMIGGVGILLAISIFITSLLVSLRAFASRLTPRQLEHYSWLALIGDGAWQFVYAVVSVLVTIALFTFVYRVMPNGRVTLRDSIPGAVVAGLLWEVSKYVFASSLHYFHYDQIYGSVGAVVAVLTWSYVSSLIMLFGAQLSVVFHQETSGLHDEVTEPQQMQADSPAPAAR
ncbi:MAG: YihY/virulence factor BrkB family protein [Acidobacteria bacterium]|nr:YihY/virulence factor BrkB family protein [Acidobacteriota bacterium]MCA1641088.1 YihY/virulence factor BrkB family protein [Acidobacteriota bacterium]